MNPNLFRMQENPDGLAGHEERELLSKQLAEENKPVKKPKRIVEEIPVFYPNPYSTKVTKRILRQQMNVYTREECEYYDERCEKRDCIYCKENGVPKDNIKNCIEWM